MKTRTYQILGLLTVLPFASASADVLAEWTFNTGGTSAARLASSNVAAGAQVSGLSFNDSFDDVGPGAVPSSVHDGFGFGGNSGDEVVFLSRANYFDGSAVPDPRPTEGDYTSWGSGAEQGTGADLTMNGNVPIAFTVTGDAISTVTIDSITVDFTSGAAFIVEFQEAGAAVGASVTLNGANPLDDAVLNAPVVIAPGETKTFTININSGALDSSHNIDGFALNGTVVRDTPIPSLAEWTFDTGGDSAARLASSGVAAGAQVSGLSFNDSFTDVGPGAVPSDVHDGFGFGGNLGDQVIFLHRANYFDGSAVPPKEDVSDYTSWGSAAGQGTGADLSSDGNAPIAFTVTADAISTITLNSLTVDYTGGAASIWQIQEAGEVSVDSVTINGANPLGTTALNAPVVIGPGETKTLTISVNSGALNSFSNIDGLSLNGTVESSADPFQTWALANGLTEGVNDGFDQNPESDSYANGLEWILGGTTPLAFDGIGIGTTGELLNLEVDGSNNLIFTFQRIDESEGVATLKVQFSNDLFDSDNQEVTIGASGPDGVPPAGVTVDIVENGAAADDVTVTIPASYGDPDGRLFGRLQGTQP